MKARDQPRPGHRNRTRQRERLLELILSTDAHPSAAELFDAMQGDFPRLSLGTVYRNLDVLVSEGEIDEIPSVGSLRRYHANLEQHSHFICEVCGVIRDITLPVPKQLKSSLRRKHRLSANRIRVDFFGVCVECGPGRGQRKQRTKPSESLRVKST